MSIDTQALINYYAREGYWRHIQTVCSDPASRKWTGDACLMLWRSYNLVLEGSFSEALRELDSLSGQRDVELAATALSLHAHRQCRIVDEDAVAHLTRRFETDERSTSERALLLAATLFWHLGGDNLPKARDLVERVLRVQPQYTQAQCLRGWIDLTLEMVGAAGRGNSGSAARALQTFEEVLGKGGKDLEALLGKAKYYELKEDYSKALAEINQVIVSHPWFVPALNEKAKMLMLMGDWELALEITQRILHQDASNIEALRLTALFLLSRESRPAVAAKRVGDILESIDRKEPKNAALYYNVARPFARVAGRGNPTVLQKTLALAERAHKLAPQNSVYTVEVGYQQLLLGNTAAALQAFKLGALDEMNLDAMYGIIHCQLQTGQLAEAGQQLEFLHEISTSIDHTLDLLYLSAQHEWLTTRDRERTVALLCQALDAHSKALKGVKPGYEYYGELNPDLLLEMSKLLLTHCGSTPRGPMEPPPPYLARAIRVIETVSVAVPGSMDAQLLLARAKVLAGDLEAAQRAVLAGLHLDPACADAHMLLSEVYLAQGKYKVAGQALEQALSHDFTVRDSPMYSVVRAQVLMNTGEVEDALRVLEAAMAAPGIRHSAPPTKGGAAVGKKRGGGEGATGERVSIFLLLAEAHMRLNHLPEATKIIQDAINEFSGTPEEVRVTIANTELALKRGDADGALAMLRAVPASSPHFIKAKMAMADIYLKHRNDPAMYASCYAELAEAVPDTQTQVLLGEALLRIQEPQRAIQAFESALKRDPQNAELASKIGKALVTTHDYAKAIDYYESAVGAGLPAGAAGSEQEEARTAMQLDLAELYLKLKRFDKSGKVLNEVLERGGGEGPNISQMALNVKGLLLLAKVHKGQGKVEATIEVVQRARSLQLSLLSKSRGEPPDAVLAQRQVAAVICHQLAQEFEAQKSVDKALSLYTEAIKHSEAHVPSMLALVQLHLARGEVEQCQAQCVVLLRADPMNDEASMLLAALMLKREQFDAAIVHFQQLVERKPNNHAALAQLMHLLRRAGRTSDMANYVRMAEKASPRSAMDAGLNFCKGLHARYSNNPHEALQHLNLARKDAEWGTKAIYAMVEVYLNPDNEAIWEESAPESKPNDNTDSIRAAEKLLAEVRHTGSKPLRHVVLECHVAMATKQKGDVEGALARLHEAVSEDKESVPVLLAIATGFMLLKHSQKARNHLKSIQKLSYDFELGDEFERSWLMLADIYIQGGKHELAQELCKKCLKYNKSCTKAWEYLGQVMEKEQSYKDAAEHYENAWAYEREASPAVGYKLAFNYLKAKRYVEAITVCHKVIGAYPSYPRIKKDILEKARASLRP